MREAVIRMWGILLMIISIFLLIGGLYLPTETVTYAGHLLLLWGGIIVLALGIILYKVIRKDE